MKTVKLDWMAIQSSIAMNNSEYNNYNNYKINNNYNILLL